LVPARLRKIDLVAETVTTIPFPVSYSGPFKLASDGRELFVDLGSFYAMDLATETFRFVANRENSSTGGMWAGSDGLLYISDYSRQQVLRLNLATQQYETLFGGLSIRNWVDGKAWEARFREPGRIWGDGKRLYIVDSGNHVIRVADLNTSEVTTLAGTGRRIADQAVNPATPSAVSWSDGTYLYFATPVELGPPSQIWRMPLSGGPATVIAGAPAPGYADGPADVAQFTFATYLWGDGSSLYVIDGFGDRLRKISLQTGEVSTLVNRPDINPFRTTLSRSIWGNGKFLYLSGRTVIYQVDLATGALTTAAGLEGAPGSNDGIGQNARFYQPAGLWGDGDYLYIADSFNGAIRRMSLTTNAVTTIAGFPGLQGIADGIGRSALFNYPSNIWGDGTYLYIRDNYAVRRLTLATNEVRTIAGSGTRGQIDGFGSKAQFYSTSSFWGVGGVLYLTDDLRVRALDTTTAEVFTIAGRPAIFADGVGMAALFNTPTGIWGDSNYVYVTEQANHVLRQIDRRTSEVRTVAGVAGQSGSTDSVGARASFKEPKGICGVGDAIYVADYGNQSIRKVTIGGWRVETLLSLDRPLSGLWCDKIYVYVSDPNRILRITLATKEMTVLVTGLQGWSPLWSDGRFLYFFDINVGGIKRLNLATKEVATINSSKWPSTANIWGDGRYLYIASDFSIQRLNLATLEVSNVAGSDPTFGSEDGVGAAARFYRHAGLWGESATLYVADTGNHAIRTIALDSSPAGTTFTPFSIPRNASISRITGNTGQPLQAGYARVRADNNSTAPSGIAVYGFRSNGVLVSETGVPAVAAIQAGRLFAQTTNNVRTGLAIANPNSQSVTISFYFTDGAGQNFGAGSFVLDANRQVAAFLNEQPFVGTALSPSALSNAQTFTFSASQPAAAIALRGYVNERSDFLMTTLPIADLSRSTTSEVVIPHFAEGGGWTTEIALLNPSDAGVAGALAFFDQGGTRIESQPYSIAARSAILIRRTLNDAAIRVGSIHVTPAAGQQSPVGLSIFSYAISGITVTQTGVPTMAPSAVLTIYSENSSTLRSGFAFANASSNPAIINYDAISSDGSSIGMRGSLNLPANGQKALFLTELPGSQALPAEFKGTLRITASGGLISAIGLRGRTNERNEFLVSTTMPDSNSATQAELYIPHFVQGGGYTTEFILMGADSASSGNTGAVEYYSQQGGVLGLSFPTN
jgi:hypothetical protein